MMSQMTLVFGIGPALAPVIGGALLNLLGWRSIFWAMLAWTIAMLVLCIRVLPETCRPRSVTRCILVRYGATTVPC